MTDKKDFTHLPLPLKIDGRAYYRKPSVPPQVQTAHNNKNREIHGNNLKSSAIQDDGNFKWTIHEKNNWGIIKDFNRKNQTLQKDWCIVNSNELSEEFCIAVRGHKGWGSLFKAKYAIAVSFEAVDQNISIYEPIRLNNQVEVVVESQEVRVEIKDFLEES